MIFRERYCAFIKEVYLPEMALKEENTYDVIVVGAGHAGCEAALASARMGAHTLLLNLYLDNTALMP